MEPLAEQEEEEKEGGESEGSGAEGDEAEEQYVQELLRGVEEARRAKAQARAAQRAWLGLVLGLGLP